MHEPRELAWLVDMDRRSAIAQLPGTYGFALFLRESGLGDDAISTRLGLDPNATTNLLTIAEAKLATLLRESTTGESP